MTKTFGKYRLLDELGSGGMATVHRAMLNGPEGFELELVIKRIRGDFSGMTSNSLAMLLTEARISAKLRHPSIVQVYELGDVDGDFYLAMELVDGWDLRRLLEACEQRRRALSPGVACFIVGQVANALAYAHSLKEVDGRPLGILHRDLSPSNMMVTPAGGVKLLDFGIAKVAAHVRHDLPDTAEHTIKGKVVYMSPEQSRGMALDGRSDLFSLGIVFYELLTGQRPFSGQNMLDTMLSIYQGKITPPSKLRSTIPKEVDAVILKLLAPDKEQRYANGTEVFQALTKLTRRLEGDASSLQTTIEELGLPSTRSQTVEANRDGRDPATSLESLFRRDPMEGPDSGPNSAGIPTDVGAIIYRGDTPQVAMPRTPFTTSRIKAAVTPRRTWPVVLVAALVGAVGGVWLWSHGQAHEGELAAALVAPHGAGAPAAAPAVAPEPAAAVAPVAPIASAKPPSTAAVAAEAEAGAADPAGPSDGTATHHRDHHAHRGNR
jgi:serine/threonine protein kinase